jgi:hypothetical protein
MSVRSAYRPDMSDRLLPRRPALRPRSATRRGRLRLVAAVALVATLAAAWLVVGRGGHPSAPVALGASGTGSPSWKVASTAGPRPPTAALRSHLADAGRCVDQTGTIPAVRCAIGGVDVEFELVGSAVAAAYRRATGVAPRPHTGTPACATGRPEERSWARATAPTRVIGRYTCEIARGHAEMWWSDDHGILAHAVAPDTDLAALFTWWLRHPTE